MIQLACNRKTLQIVRMCYGMSLHLGKLAVTYFESLEKERYEVINSKVLGN